MKRTAWIALPLLIGLGLGIGWNIYRDSRPVHFTSTGKSYHRPDCGHLRGSTLTTTISHATASGLKPCRRCKP